MTTYPKIESIARNIDLNECIESDPDILELYGYHSPILNRSNARDAINRAYFNKRDKYLPWPEEMSAGVGIVEERFRIYLEANR
jgi:hypothetical protein